MFCTETWFLINVDTFYTKYSMIMSTRLGYLNWDTGIPCRYANQSMPSRAPTLTLACDNLSLSLYGSLHSADFQYQWQRISNTGSVSFSHKIDIVVLHTCLKRASPPPPFRVGACFFFPNISDSVIVTWNRMFTCYIYSFMPSAEVYLL